MPPEPAVAAAAPVATLARRLPGRSPSLRWTRLSGNARLWIDGEQLIQETVLQSTQEIHRFALADIQAVQVQRTARGMIYNLVLAGLLATALIIVYFSVPDDSGALPLRTAIFCGPFLLLILLNTLRGPTSRALLTTVLGPQPLSSLSRMRPALRAMDAIHAGVEAVQGALRPEDAMQAVDRARMPAPSASTPAAPATKVTLPGYHY